MKIKWSNIFGLIFLVVILVLLFRLPKILDELSYRIYLPYYFNDPVYGLMFFGLACVTIVAVVKLLRK